MLFGMYFSDKCNMALGGTCHIDGDFGLNSPLAYFLLGLSLIWKLILEQKHLIFLVLWFLRTLENFQMQAAKTDCMFYVLFAIECEHLLM